VKKAGLVGDGYIAALDGVSKSYGTVQAVSNISFGVKKGEIFGYIGPNGAGKTIREPSG
jgi:ABC-2 type transport system ATP-binding protein